MKLADFLEILNKQAKHVSFDDTMSAIDQNYTFTETSFTNGDLKNHAGQNNGSCKIFAFGLLNKLNEEQTLACFGEYYRKDVLTSPKGSDHQNIRNFMKHGWAGIHFKNDELIAK